MTLLGIPAVALLDVFSNHPEELLMRWSTTLKQHQIHLIHTLATPQSGIKFILKNHFLSVKPPITRNPYYLTIKPLSHELDVTLFDFVNWDLIGGDVL